MPKVSNLMFPYSVRVSNKGDIYVADTYNHRIRKLEKQTLVGVTGGTDGATLRYPSDMAFTETNDLVISDSEHDQLVVLSARTGQLSKTKEISLVDRKMETFGSPTQIDVFDGKVFVADTFKNRVLIIDLETKKAQSLEVERPLGLAVNRITKDVTFTQRGLNKVSVWREGKVVTLAGSNLFGWTDGQGTAASFFEPFGLCATVDGRVLVADSGNHSIREIGQDGQVTTLAGNRTKGSQDGSSATFNYPLGVTIGRDGVIYVADTYNHLIRKIYPSLEVETVI